MDRTLDQRRQEITGILPNLRRFALSLTGSMADADDLLQSTVERLLERGLPADAEVLPWSLRVCRNLWIDELRHRKVQREASDQIAAGSDASVCGEQQVLGELTLAEVQQVLASMPDEQCAVLELVAVEGYAYKEAAAVLGIPIGTVMSRLARARSALAELYSLTTPH
jgi:RNA polymerase sigma-70 factor (ECF subfamily)